ncbi:hypothetical protein BD410DRAFT_382997 [Rickenella mellea]|uniref:Uncharacterized protein n=1 Tax=Rickenella mellea TaxID=50990 RepID=A0A4Y7PYR9_9AGAM|nr:hypothetical protein BD410DRAFT_382997 [Rickenella mellea]
MDACDTSLCVCGPVGKILSLNRACDKREDPFGDAQSRRLQSRNVLGDGSAYLRRRMPRASDGTKASCTEQLILKQPPQVIYFSMQIYKQSHDTHYHRATGSGAVGPSPRRRLHHFRRGNAVRLPRPEVVRL